MLHPLTLLLWLCTVYQCYASLIDICTKSKNSQREPLMAALLDLHTGEHCDQPVIPSFQQLAVIEASIKQINQRNKIKLGFQVFDTCSSEQGAVTASMQAFVASQQTCLHSPLFTGFIGPENIRFLRVVKNFTNSFNFSHILAYSVLSYGAALDKAVFVAKYPVIQFAKATEVVVQRLEVKSPLIIAEEGIRGHAISQYLANHRAALIQGAEGACLKRIVVTISSPQHLEESIPLMNDHDGVIFIVESDWFLKSISRMLDSESIDDPIIIVDLKNSASQSQHVWAENVLIINQMSYSESQRNRSSMAMSVSNAVHSFVTDSGRICSKHKLTTCNDQLLSSIMEEEYDWTLQLYRMAVLLLGSALKEVESVKCEDVKPCLTPDVISQNEWHDYLRQSTYNLESGTGDKNELYFGIELPASYILKTSFGPEGLRTIGKVEKDKVIVVATDYLPVRIKNATCPEHNRNLDEPTTESTIHIDFLDGLLNPENAKLMEAVGLVCGAVVGVLLMMLLLTTCVYRNFNPDSSRPRSPSSHTTLSRAGSSSS